MPEQKMGRVRLPFGPSISPSSLARCFWPVLPVCLLLLPEIAARQIGVRALAAKCRARPVRSVCGGGLYSHRYDEDTGFLNPSVYCPDLLALIRHIRGRVLEDLKASRAREVAG